MELYFWGNCANRDTAENLYKRNVIIASLHVLHYSSKSCNVAQRPSFTAVTWVGIPLGTPIQHIEGCSGLSRSH